MSEWMRMSNHGFIVKIFSDENAFTVDAILNQEIDRYFVALTVNVKD